MHHRPPQACRPPTPSPARSRWSRGRPWPSGAALVERDAACWPLALQLRATEQEIVKEMIDCQVSNPICVDYLLYLWLQGPAVDIGGYRPDSSKVSAAMRPSHRWGCVARPDQDIIHFMSGSTPLSTPCDSPASSRVGVATTGALVSSRSSPTTSRRPAACPTTSGSTSRRWTTCRHQIRPPHRYVGRVS